MLNEIVPAIIGLVLIWGIGIWEYLEFSKSKIFLLFSLVVTVCIVLGTLEQVGCKYIKPPTTIEENGYTYQLEDYEPEEVEETIEKYGKIYVLIKE